MELGADAVELDVHRARDGIIVVHHDPTVTLKGRGAMPITALDGADITAVQVRGEPIPTLRDVLRTLAGRLRVYCELKGRGTAEGTVSCLREAAAPGAVHAFDHREVAAAQAIAPEIPRGVLEASYPLDALAALRSVAARDLWRHVDHVDEPLVREAHAAGARVISWTVNDASTMERFAAWGVDGLCTDDVALARSVLR